MPPKAVSTSEAGSGSTSTIAAIRLETASILCACRDDIQNSHPTGANSLAAPPLLPPGLGAPDKLPLGAHPERPALIERSGKVGGRKRVLYLPGEPETRPRAARLQPAPNLRNSSGRRALALPSGSPL